MLETPDAVNLPHIAYPLANQFYRSNRSRMRARGHHQVLVLHGSEIHAALCLQPVADGNWLTNLLVGLGCRRRGYAAALLARAREEVKGPIWLFCHPDLECLYESAGYRRCSGLPAELASRLDRYRQTKMLIAMLHAG